jgi:hypothetical protein
MENARIFVPRTAEYLVEAAKYLTGDRRICDRRDSRILGRNIAEYWTG